MGGSSVAIIGAGFSGTLLALHLSRHCPETTRISLIEQRADFGPGLAYSTDCPDHLLNVPAGRMSAFPDQPHHFLEWLQRRSDEFPGGSKPGAGSFVPRHLYGRYLRELLADAVRASLPGTLELVRGKVVATTRREDGLTIHLEGGRDIASAIAVIAMGNHPPAEPCPNLHGQPFYRDSPWASDIADGLPADATVLLIGTGLTMVDTALDLWRRGHHGPIHALSRRGLVPRAHATGPSGAPDFDQSAIPVRLKDIVRFIRTETDRIALLGGSWHAVIDALRPVTQSIWRDWPASERRRFLSHVRPWWDVCRHRLAPAIAERIEAARSSGQLHIHAGRMRGFAVHGPQADIFWRPKGTTTESALRVHRVINCSGPATDVSRSPDPLVRSMLLEGLGRPDGLGLGFDVADDGRLRGDATPVLFGVGPVSRGALWETTAVPDIRVQCQSLAHHIAQLLRQKDTPDTAPVYIPPMPQAALARVPGLWY